MKWVVITVIIFTGGIIYYMAKKNSQLGNHIAESIIKGVQDVLNDKPLQIGRKGGIDRKEDNQEITLETRKRSSGAVPPRQSSQNNKNLRELKEKAKAILSQDPPALEEFGFPAAREILTAEAEEKRLRTVYSAMQDITQLYFERMGVRDILQSIVDTSVYIPRGLREYDAEKQSLLLHVSVWNTAVNTLNRQTAKLFLKYDKLVHSKKTAEPADIEAEIVELLKNVRTAVEESDTTKGSQDSVWKLQRAVQAYPARKTAACESLKNYEKAVSPEKTAEVLTLCEELKELMSGDAFRNLETYEIHDGEPVCVDMDGEELYLDPTTKAYWDKIGVFAEKARSLLEKWNDRAES